MEAMKERRFTANGTATTEEEITRHEVGVARIWKRSSDWKISALGKVVCFDQDEDSSA